MMEPTIIHSKYRYRAAHTLTSRWSDTLLLSVAVSWRSSSVITRFPPTSRNESMIPRMLTNRRPSLRISVTLEMNSRTEKTSRKGDVYSI